MRTVGVSTRIRVRQVYVMRLKLVRGERIRVCQVYVMRTKFKPNSVLTPNPQTARILCTRMCVCAFSLLYCVCKFQVYMCVHNYSISVCVCALMSDRFYKSLL